MRKYISFPIEDVSSFKIKLFLWGEQHKRFCFLDSNSENLELKKGNYDCIAAVGSVTEINPTENCFDSLKNFYTEKKDWLFGFFSYDLKNEIENLSSENPDRIGFPLIHFFQPKYIFILQNNVLKIGFLVSLSSENEIKNLLDEIWNNEQRATSNEQRSKISCRISEDEYLDAINKIKNHIRRGDIYEMNYCVEFFSEDAEINPAQTFLNLNTVSETPFASYFRLNDNYLLCASPEGFLKKIGNKIISQPMKGTANRGKNSEEDEQQKNNLFHSEKERSENVMIVDLVRNDLSKTCHDVRTTNLFSVQPFRQWHQMISTVEGELNEKIHFVDAIKNSFPMGSMTGAPKISAMELIEKYETTKRGLYSGALGYITPDGDFDFNVVIRNIQYNSKSKYLSFMVGSAITDKSIPEKEFEECLLKAKGMFEALNVNSFEQEVKEISIQENA